MEDMGCGREGESRGEGVEEFKKSMNTQTKKNQENKGDTNKLHK